MGFISLLRSVLLGISLLLPAACTTTAKDGRKTTVEKSKTNKYRKAQIQRRTRGERRLLAKNSTRVSRAVRTVRSVKAVSLKPALKKKTRLNRSGKKLVKKRIRKKVRARTGFFDETDFSLGNPDSELLAEGRKNRFSNAFDMP